MIGGRDRRALILGVFVLLGAWGGSRIVPMAWGVWSRMEDNLDRKVLLLEKARREAGRLAQLSDSVASLEEKIALLPRLVLLGRDEEAAAFDLVRRVSLVVSGAAAFAENIQKTGDSAVAGPLRRVSVEAVLETDITGLTDILSAVEMDSTMAVESVAVQAADAFAPPEVVEAVHAQVRVTGWYRALADPPTEPPPTDTTSAAEGA